MYFLSLSNSCLMPTLAREGPQQITSASISRARSRPGQTSIAASKNIAGSQLRHKAGTKEAAEHREIRQRKNNAFRDCLAATFVSSSDRARHASIHQVH